MYLMQHRKCRLLGIMFKIITNFFSVSALLIYAVWEGTTLTMTTKDCAFLNTQKFHLRPSLSLCLWISDAKFYFSYFFLVCEGEELILLSAVARLPLTCLWDLRFLSHSVASLVFNLTALLSKWSLCYRQVFIIPLALLAPWQHSRELKPFWSSLPILRAFCFSARLEPDLGSRRSLFFGF